MSSRLVASLAVAFGAPSSVAYQLHGVRAPLHARSTSAAAAPLMVATAEAAAPPASSAASHNSTWYSVGFSSELLEADDVFSTRLWGEPLVLYRDSDGEVTCVRDVCPHRSAPLSMGEMKDGQLRCFYHGWGFGKQGKCETVPTQTAVPNSALFCAKSYAVAEHDGMLWVWRGETLAADASKLPAVSPEPSFVVDTTLDYASDWNDLVHRNLDAPFLSFLSSVRLDVGGWRKHSDAAGAAASGGEGEVRFDADASPTVVRHTSASGFSEDYHVVPIAPERSRVLLRQRFPKGALLSALLTLPGALPLLTFIIQYWNTKQVLENEDARRADSATGTTSAAVDQFREWQAAASAAGGPFFERWAESAARQRYAPNGWQLDDEAEGTYGLKTSYVQQTPQPSHAPMRNDEYVNLIAKYQAIKEAATAAAISVPAALLTYKTVAPVVASTLGN